MASEKQIAANRRNARKSTGPKSPEGKRKVAQNRTRHGFAGASHTVLAGEDPAAYDSILATLMREWEPESEAEAFQIEVMAQSQWRLLRAARYERQAFEKRLASWGPNASFPDEVELLSRYESRIARAYYRALSTLQALQQRPAAPSCPPESTRPASSNLPPNPPDEVPVDHSNPIPPPQQPPPPPPPTPPAGSPGPQDTRTGIFFGRRVKPAAGTPVAG